MATASVNLEWALPSISAALGIAHNTTSIAQTNVWSVPGVTQDALDAALAAYDDGGAKLAIAWSNVRKDRTKLLVNSDWTQSADTALTDAVKANWATYRTALRDITTQADPYNITWPTAP
tara:strand:+ start:240 stop:599 length:360 start_codon:yes stop_codon:yes gene_type:complete